MSFRIKSTCLPPLCHHATYSSRQPSYQPNSWLFQRERNWERSQQSYCSRTRKNYTTGEIRLYLNPTTILNRETHYLTIFMSNILWRKLKFPGTELPVATGKPRKSLRGLFLTFLLLSIWKLQPA